jgi:hypothetical protein
MSLEVHCFFRELLKSRPSQKSRELRSGPAVA